MLRLIILTAFICGVMLAAENPAADKDKQNRQKGSRLMNCDVLVIGGGAGGSAAGIQSARSGAKTIIMEPTVWLGGMLTAAGVSATDGNHRLPCGIWNEFRDSLYRYYGGPQAVQTGWVSYTQFEPGVGQRIFRAMAGNEKNLEVVYNSVFQNVIMYNRKVTGAVFKTKKGETISVTAKMVIDATELGDVFKNAGAGYDVGMESKAYTGEDCAYDTAYGLIQDITYAAILKDYGPKADMTIPKPASYDSTMFACACKTQRCSTATSTSREMLDYGKLPNGKYMINWPEAGNDYYVNAIEMSYEEREQAYAKAKEKTLSFIYYLQTSLGYKNLGLAEDEFPSMDKLPLIPYNREGRRVKGLVRFTVNDILQPYTRPAKLYRTSVSVGDYPIDHHAVENFKIPPREYPGIPSFGIPMGCLIPRGIEGLIVAEKGISVSNIVNGATRLQPAVLLTGQAAGFLAAYCAENNIQPEKADVRSIQKKLLDNNACIMPFIDVLPADPDFKAIQRIGATGIMQGFGVVYSWENETWFYPSRDISQYEIVQGLKTYYKVFEKYNEATGDDLDLSVLIRYISMAGKPVTTEQVRNDWQKLGIQKTYSEKLKMDRRMTAVLIDYYLRPFDLAVDLWGKFN